MRRANQRPGRKYHGDFAGGATNPVMLRCKAKPGQHASKQASKLSRGVKSRPTPGQLTGCARSWCTSLVIFVAATRNFNSALN